MENEKQSFAGDVVVEASAQVIAINAETREVKMEADGEKMSMIAGPEVQNFAQIEVGDVLTVEYHDIALGAIAKEGDSLDEAMEMIATAEPGEKPGVVVADTEAVTVTVDAIDGEVVTFTTPDGVQHQRKPYHPTVLEFVKSVSVGDRVDIIRTHAMAITMTKKEG